MIFAIGQIVITSVGRHAAKDKKLERLKKERRKEMNVRGIKER